MLVQCPTNIPGVAAAVAPLQVTPAHDPNDFATGKRHGLESINIFDDNGLINDKGGPFKGQPRFKVCD